MFTGTIKLTNIDDYIAPSQNCIQPKIMKKDLKQQKATVTLNDCLACSGCITSAQSILIQQMSINKFKEITNGDEQVYIMISPQSLLSLAKYFKHSPSATLKKLNTFIRNHFKKVIKIFQMSLAIQLAHQLIFQQFIQRFNNKNIPVLCSQCPGWVCYAQKKTEKDAVTHTMSCIKSPQQIMGQLIKNKYGKNCKVMSIMPCYDKKLQAIRFQHEQKIKEVDLTLATTQIVDLIKMHNMQQYFWNKEEKVEQAQNHFDFQNQQQGNKPQLSFVKDQTSNGYIQFILSRLGIKQYKCQDIKNSDFKQYSFTWNQNSFKMAKCYGFRNIQKIVQLVKKNKCPYLYVEIMACPGGCYSGGGQIRYEGIKNKEIVTQFQQIVKNYRMIEGSFKLYLQKFDLDRSKVMVQYKPIQKTLGESVTNW